jgi:hypothetical protein
VGSKDIAYLYPPVRLRLNRIWPSRGRGVVQRPPEPQAQFWALQEIERPGNSRCGLEAEVGRNRSPGVLSHPPINTSPAPKRSNEVGQ